MLSALLPRPLVGVLTFVAMAANVVFWGAGVVLPGSFVKLLLPLRSWRRGCTHTVIWAAERWVGTNRLIFRLMHGRHWQLRIDGDIQRGRSYLIVCNHQSWADIPVLCDALHGRAHFPRFFLKRELIWVPVIGAACWALDMPFMKRHGPQAVAADPRLREEDLRTTRRFCEKLRSESVAVVNFLEGTRFTEAKRRARQSPHRHLLRAKAAGLSFALNAMGDQFSGLIDMTIAYRRTPPGRSIFWSFLCGEQDHLVVHAELRPIPAALAAGDYEADPDFRARFQEWVNSLWAHKDAQLEWLKAQAGAARPPTAAAPQP